MHQRFRETVAIGNRIRGVLLVRYSIAVLQMLLLFVAAGLVAAFYYPPSSVIFQTPLKSLAG